MGKIIVIDPDGVTREYDRGVVFGFCHEAPKMEDRRIEVDIDYIRCDVCTPELLECDRIMDKMIERQAKKDLSRVIKNGEFGDFMDFLLSDALTRGKSHEK